MMDVVSRKCQMEGCLKRPWYSYDGVKSMLCAEHKTPGMIGYRPPQKDIVVGGGGGGVGTVGVIGVIGGRKRGYEEINIHHQHQHLQHHAHHHHHHPCHEGGDASDLVPEGLDSVGLAEMDMGEDGLQGAGGLGLVGMGSEHHLEQPRMGVGVPGLGDGGVLDAAGMGDGSLDPTGLGSADHHLGHGALGQRGLDTPGLDADVGHHDGHDGHHHHHHHHDGIMLQTVLPPHAAHPGSVVGPSDKIFH